MKKTQYVTIYFDKNTISGPKLFIFWFAGLSLGLFAACFCVDSLVSLITIMHCYDLSFVNAIVSAVFPLLLSVLTVFFFSPSLIHLICFLWSLNFGFVSGGILIGCAGYSLLMCFLLMFSSVMTSPMLLWYWGRRVIGNQSLFWLDTVFTAGGCATVGLINYFVISPFLVDIVNY